MPRGISDPREVLASQHRHLDLIAHSVPAAMSNIARYANLTVGPHASIPYPPMQGGPPPTDTSQYRYDPQTPSTPIDPHHPATSSRRPSGAWQNVLETPGEAPIMRDHEPMEPPRCRPRHWDSAGRITSRVRDFLF